MNRASLLLALSLVACTEKPSPSQNAPAPSASVVASSSSAKPSAEVPMKELATQVVGWLQAGEDGKVRALFDDAMSKALPTDAAVATMWSGIEAKVGKLEQVLESNETSFKGMTFVLVTCRFASGPMDLKLVFDPARKIAGFFIVATQNANAYGPRPQTPKPPFDYEARDVGYDDKTNKMHFAGTLTLPKGAGPFPAVLLITGSGTQDRDETILGHKPFLVIADALAKKGIAALRVDDPGAGGSTGDVKNATVESHARDALVGIAFLKTQPGIDPKRLAILGHSEGGIIAAIVASQSEDVRAVVSLAGTGLPGAEINPLQIEAILRADGKMTEEGIKAVVDSQRKIMKLLAKDADDAQLEAAVKDAFDTAARYATSATDKKATQQDLAASLETLKTPWFKSFVKLDPATYWSKVTVPVLALVGDKDTQVPADPNLVAIKRALVKNKNVDAEKLAGLNHLFQPAKTGLLEEYATIEITFDDRGLAQVTDWIAQHLKE